MRQRIKLAFAAAFLLGVGATDVASAADMAVKARPVVAPIMPWTGCYIGGNIGGGRTQVDTTPVFQDIAVPASANYGRENDSSFIGSGQVGCDFQTGSLVMGIGGQFDFGNINGRHALADFPAFSETNNLRAIYTATGRVGWLWTPSFLGYVKGGIAFLSDRNQVFTPGGALIESSSFTELGMTVGIGGEWMFAPNWSVFAEYNYMWFHDDSAQHFDPTPGFVGEVINVRQRRRLRWSA